jgi:thiamine-phosphate pyrophosphorylase
VSPSAAKSFTIYPIIDHGLCAVHGVDPVVLTGACLRGGARILQLRMKAGPDAEFLTLADRLVGLIHSVGGQLIVNDRADIAVMAGADGVHVGQEDLPVAEVRRLLGDAAIIGVSTHDHAEVDEALRTSASYVAVGPVFSTTSKDTGYAPRGLELVRYAAQRGKPIVAIGGITLERAFLVAEAGADRLAVISDLFAGDPEVRVRSFLAAGVPKDPAR